MPQSMKVVAIVFVLLAGMIGFDSARSNDHTLPKSKSFAASFADRQVALTPVFISNEIKQLQIFHLQLLGVLVSILFLLLLMVLYLYFRKLLLSLAKHRFLLEFSHIRNLCMADNLVSSSAEQIRTISAQLQSSQEEILQLRAALLQAQEKEKNNLGQTLHDGLGQYVAGMRAQIKLLQLVSEQPLKVQAVAQCLEEQARELHNGFRCLVRDLYPAMLERQDLAQILQNLQYDWQRNHPSVCRLHLVGLLPQLTLQQKTQLYRFFQEALTNVARHAHATEVRIWLQYKQQTLRVLLRDNGKGTAEHQPGLGQHSMAERARMLNAQLHIQKGTTRGWGIYLSVPLRGQGL